MQKAKIVKLENRAWKGLRCYVGPLRSKDGNLHTYEIMWHVTRGAFALNDEIQYTRRKGKPTYAGTDYYAKTTKPLIQWIEKTYNVKVEITDPDFNAQEQYDIEDGARLWNKYPSWKCPPTSEKILQEVV